MNTFFRSHIEEPGTGADRAAEERSGAGEILSGLLRCPESVFTAASSTQATQSHAGVVNTNTHDGSCIISNQIHSYLLSRRRWLTQTSQPRRSSRNTRKKSKPKRGRLNSSDPDIKPRNSVATLSKIWPWCSDHITVVYARRDKDVHHPRIGTLF